MDTDHPTSRYTRAEEIVNSLTHGIGAVLAIAGLAVLTAFAAVYGDGWHIVSSAVFGATLILLYLSSTLYHAVHHPRIKPILRILDHSAILVLIAGTYTPITVGTLTGNSRVVLLCVVWIGALLGISINLLWPSAPRWLSTLIYVILGWTAVWFLPQMWRQGGPAIVILVGVGGVLYTVGAVAYALKKPNPWPEWFGFHEIFHVFTVLAWACQCVAAYMAVLS